MTHRVSVPRISGAQFAEFFSAVNGGKQPFTWQQELVDYILERGEWPRQIGAPTGSGKSSVVDIHVFVNAVTASEGPRIPRRLHTVVNRRALVDNQADRATHLAEALSKALNDAEQHGIIHDVARALLSLRGDGGSVPLEVGHLRGDLPTRSLPLSELSACAVVAATPDMWGSRLLFRGYGASRNARPRETAFVALDSVVVVDESHLNRQLVFTARRIAQLQRRETDIGVPTLQVTETTATVADAEDETLTIRVTADNMAGGNDDALRQRLNAAKSLTYVELVGWNGKPKNPQVVKTTIDEATRLHGQFGGTIGVIVNHVDTAINVAAALRKAGLTVLTLVGRMRPWDLKHMREEYPGAFTIAGDPRVDVVVATQTLEVGVDVSFRAMVTELAPGAALAQRWGRVNRLGEYTEAEVVILGPGSAASVTRDAPPYTAQDLQAAHGWIQNLLEEGSVAPAVLDRLPAPSARLSRPVLQRVELTDLDFFARTSDPLVGEPSLELWLRDDLNDDQTMVGVVVRGSLPQDHIPALELLRAFPPREEEVFPGRIADVRTLLEKKDLTRAFLYRNAELSLWDEQETHLQPGDVVVVDERVKFTTENIIDTAPKDPPAKPVSHGERVDVQIHLVPEKDSSRANIFHDLVDATPADAMELLGVSPEKGEVVVSRSIVILGGRDAVAWYAIRPLVADESGVMQEWTLSTHRVLLEAHQRDVATRALDVCRALGIDPTVAAQIEKAGLHHDDGKIDRRFQRMLGKDAEDAALAKSELRTKQEVRRAHMLSGLPAGWRHEQLSALLFAHQFGLDEHTELALRIIGTSHGRGRSGFPHVGAELLEEAQEDGLLALADELFTRGEWDRIIARGHAKYGHYATAFAEAVERAADAQISKEQK